MLPVHNAHMDRLLNPNTGDYEANGEMTDTLQNAVYISLITPLGSYCLNPSLGSLLHTLKREKDVSRVGLLAEQYAYEALEHILDDGRAKQIDITADQPHNGAMILNIIVIDNRGVRSVFKHLVSVI